MYVLNSRVLETSTLYSTVLSPSYQSVFTWNFVLASC